METKLLAKGVKKFREKIYLDSMEIKGPYFLRKSDAKEWKRNMEHLKDKGKAALKVRVQLKDKTFAQFVDEFLENKVKNQLCLRTYLNYKCKVKNHLLPFLKDTKIQKITSAHWDFLIQRMKEHGHTTESINSVLRTFKRIINEALVMEYFSSDPFKNCSQLKKSIQKEVFLSKEDIQLLYLANQEDVHIDLIMVALNTGMRRGELAGLCWDKVHFDRKLIEVARTRDQYEFKDNTKSGVRRFVPMNSKCISILLKLHEQRKNENDYVFKDQNGQAFNVHHFYRIFQRMQEKAKLTKHYCFHDLRHTFSSHFMMNGGNLYDLQKILGHSKSETTQRYAHLSLNHLNEVISIINF